MLIFYTTYVKNISFFEDYSPSLDDYLILRGEIGTEKDLLKWKIVLLYFWNGWSISVLQMISGMTHSNISFYLCFGYHLLSIHAVMIIFQRLHFPMKFRLWNI